jgi:TonB family protein
MIAAILLAWIAAGPAPAPSGVCSRENVRVVEESNFVLPDTVRATHDRVRFLLDIGSDGRVRRMAKVESSGDGALDAAAEKALGEFRFAAPTVNCVSASSVWSQWWSVPPEAIVQPPAASAAAAVSPGSCVPPFVRPVGFPLPAHIAAPGTVAVDVALDATAHVTGVHLAQSSGNTKTDYAATVAARNGRYVFERQPGCAPAATTYRFEITFH